MALRTLGDVLSRSGACVTVSDDATIRTLASALVKHHVAAVSVLSATDGCLCGIATGRDVAKCIARNLDLDTTSVSLVMTPNPITLPPSETPANALTLMRQGQFRHIPVVAPDSSVIGIVDVLSLAYDAITRLQLSYSMIPSRRGYDMLRAARETIEKPTLRPIVERTPLTTLSPNDNVGEACELIVTKHTAAIVVVDHNGVIDGIFTCTDVVKRVVAAKKDPATLRVSDVMTGNPDCASPDFTILECLQRMQACGFRNLPVVDDQSRVVIGIVDVLQLASDTLLNLNSTSPSRNSATRRSNAKLSPQPTNTRVTMGAQGGVGLARGLANFFGSLFSNSYAQRDVRSDANSVEASADGHAVTSNFSIPFPPRTSNASRPNASRPNSFRGFSAPKLPPNLPVEPRGPSRRHYGYLPVNIRGRSRQARADVPLASFKFKDVNGNFRRIKVPMVLERGDFDQFVLDVRRRFGGSSRSSIGAVKIMYVDEDEDDVLISNDDDLASCFEDVARDQGRTVILKVEEDRAASSKLQSPVSSAPSSVIGSPTRRTLSMEHNNQDNQDDVPGSLKPSVEPPPLDKPLPSRDERRPSGVYRTHSRLKMLTPSAKKANEGHQMMLDKRIDEAIIMFTEALELDEKNSRAIGERGAAHLLNGSTKDAEVDYHSAIKMMEDGKQTEDMSYQMCLVGLVETLIDQRRYEEAVEVSCKMQPEWGNSGCADAFRDELEISSSAAQQALESNEFADAMNCFSNALRVESSYLKALSEGGGGEEMGRVSLRLGRAKCYKALKDYEMALEDYEGAAKLDPDSVSAQKGRGKCFMELDRLPLALEAYEKAHGLDPVDEEVMKEISTLKTLLPDPLQSNRDTITQLGSLISGMQLPKKIRMPPVT